ncbi:hypothetical protein PENTCL1PPCAC_29219, partial [Pristionchus entomophagus]
SQQGRLSIVGRASTRLAKNPTAPLETIGRRMIIDATTMPWRLLFLAAAGVVVTASLPQPNGGVREPSKCVELNGTDEVIGITSLGNVLAVASRHQATIHNIAGTRQQCRKTDEIKFPKDIDGTFTEFKLLNETSLLYCTSTNCNYCPFGEASFCRELEVRVDKRDVEISMAAATQTGDGKKILVRVVFGQRSLLLAFEEPLLDETRLIPISTALDVAFLEQQRVAAGFNVDGFSYFITSAYQPYEPTAEKKEKRERSFRVKIMRVCDGDKTDVLESRIDISLDCPGVDDSTNKGVTTATFSTADRQVFVVFSTTFADDFVCSYSLDEVNKKIDHMWDVCQSVSWKNTTDCRYYEEPLPEHCMIFTRNGDHGRPLQCSRYGADTDKPTHQNCRLHEYTPTAYRYAWLESYISMDGKPVVRINNNGKKYNQMFLDESHNALFLTGDDRMARVPARFDGAKNANNVSTFPSLVKYYKPSSRFAMAHVTSSSFLLIEHNRVDERDITCASLFEDCDSLAKGGFSDPLQCVFCSMSDDENGGFVMDRSEKNSCQRPLFEKCPPVIRDASQNNSRKEQWVIVGDSLQTLSNPHAFVCDQPCHIDFEKAGEKSFTCTLQSSAVLDPTCSVKFEGLLESYPKFTVTPIKRISVDAATQTVTSKDAQSGTMSRNWKIVIGVVAIILIIAIIIIIILGARKYLGVSSSQPLLYNGHNAALMRNNQKGNGAINLQWNGNGRDHEQYPQRGAARNTYLSTDPSGMPFAHNMSPAHAPAYERLFREIDSRLKIPSDHLLLEKQIGKGHFGVVLKGTYNPPDGATRAVACKTLTGHVAGGISEFVNEGLMMDRFDHPRVMTLVGISFNEDRMPIIVTDYMENGDLAKYLRDVKNKPTLRDLLNFTHEIALGMAYLHDNKFIHRDLAARNCMLDRDLHVKVADFGLCREATSQDEYLPIHSGREMPLRWMAPEALEREQFTMAGDVWAFGVVIWEVMTRGMNPYPNLQAYVLFEFLKAGKRMGKPDFCPDILFRVMLDCWHGEQTMRPTFKELPDQIDEIIDVLSNNSRVQMNAEYEQVNSVRNSRAASSTATTPITHQAISHVHSYPLEQSPEPTPV